MLLLLLHLGLKELHGIGLGLLGYLNIRLHRLIVGMAGPLHHNLRRYAAGECETDEGTGERISPPRLREPPSVGLWPPKRFFFIVLNLSHFEHI